MSGDVNKAATLSVDIDTGSSEAKLTRLRTSYVELRAEFEKTLGGKGFSDVANGVDKAKKSFSEMGAIGHAELKRLAEDNTALKLTTRNLEEQIEHLKAQLKDTSASAKAMAASMSTGLSGMSRKVRVDLKELGDSYTSLTDRMIGEGKRMAQAGFDSSTWAKGYRLSIAEGEASLKKYEQFVRKVREAKAFLADSGAPETTKKQYGSGILEHISRLAEHEARLKTKQEAARQKPPVDATPEWKTARQMWVDARGSTEAFRVALAQQNVERQRLERAAVGSIDTALASAGARAAAQAGSQVAKVLAERNDAILKAQRESTTRLTAGIRSENALRQKAELAALAAAQIASEKFTLASPRDQARTVAIAARRIEKGQDVSRMAPEAIDVAQQLGSFDAAKAALNSLTDSKKNAAKAAAELSAQTKLSGQQLHHWNTLANEGHAAARGLSGALGGLWMTYGSIAPLVATAAMAGALKQVFSVGKELEFQFTMVSAISNGATVDLERFNEAVAGTMFTPVEAAKGLRVMAQAGLSVAEATAALPAVLKLATVGETDMANAALSATAIMHSFGLSVQDMAHIGDVFAKAAAISATSVTGMMEAMKQASAVSDMFGVKMEETAAALATLANRGIEGSAAGTALRNMVKELASPATDKARYAMKSLGIEVHNADGSAKSFTDNLEQLAEAVSTMSAKGKAKFLEDLFNERGVKAANILLSDLDKLKSSLAEIKAASDGLGFMTEAQIKINMSTDGMLKTLKSDFQRVLGETFKSVEPEVKQLIGSLSDLVNSADFKAGLSGLASGVAGLTKLLVEHADVVKLAAGAYLAFKGVGVATAALGMFDAKVVSLVGSLKNLTKVDAAATTVARIAAVEAGATAAAAAATKVASTGGMAATAMANIGTAAAGLVTPITAATLGVAGFAAAIYVAYQRMGSFGEEYSALVGKLDQEKFQNDQLLKETQRGEEALDKQNKVLAEQLRLMREGATAADALAQAQKNVALSAVQSTVMSLRAQRDAKAAQVGAYQVDEDAFDKSAASGAARRAPVQSINELADLNRRLAESERVEAALKQSADGAASVASQNKGIADLQARIGAIQTLNTALAKTIELGNDAEKKLASGEKMSVEKKARLEEMVAQRNRVKGMVPLAAGERDGPVASPSEVELRKDELNAGKNDYKGKEKPDHGEKKDWRAIQNDRLSSGLKQEQLRLDSEKITLDIEVARQTLSSVDAITKKNLATEESIIAERALIATLYDEAAARGDKVQMAKLDNDLNENALKMAKQLQQSLLDEERLRTANRNAIEDAGRSTQRYIEDLEFERKSLGKTALEVANLRIERERLRAEEDVRRKLDRGEITPAAAEAQFDSLGSRAAAQKEDADYQHSFVGGWQRAFDEYQRAASNSAEAARSVFQSMSQSMEDAITKFVTTGKLSFKDFATTVLAEAARVMASKAVSGLLGMAVSFVGGAMGGAGGSGGYDTWTGGSGAGATWISPEGQLWNANGNVFSGAPSLHQYVNTVQTSPKTFAFDTLHKYAKGGVFAEAGPEAVMPLTRDSQGRLGVYAQGGAPAGASMVMINITVHEGDGGRRTEQESSGDTKGVWGQFAGRVRVMVLEEIDNQKRPGGRLWAGA